MYDTIDDAVELAIETLDFSLIDALPIHAIDHALTVAHAYMEPNSYDGENDTHNYACQLVAAHCMQLLTA